MSHPFKRNSAQLLRIEFGGCFSLKDFNEKQWKISENVSFTFLHKFLKNNFSLISCPCAAIFAFESKYSDRSSTFPTYLRIFGKKKDISSSSGDGVDVGNGQESGRSSSGSPVRNGPATDLLLANKFTGPSSANPTLLTQFFRSQKNENVQLINRVTIFV